MALQPMYPAQNNSPRTSLAEALGAGATSITLVSSSGLPAAPGLLVIGVDVDAEVVRYTGISGNTLTGVTRGFGGTTAKAWPAGTIAARNFTAYDHEALMANITDLDTNKQDKLTFDSTPTASSTNPVTSGGVKSALDAKQNTLTFDSTPTASSTNPVTSGGVKSALDEKQNTLTFDSTPTASSTNPVTSGGIKAALDEKSEPITNAASGPIVTIDDAANFSVAGLKVAIEPVQAGSGDPSPSNIRPITGWTACNLTTAGKNLLPNAITTSSYRGITLKQNDGKIIADGTANLNSEINIGTIKREPGCDYFVQGCPAGGSTTSYRIIIRFYDDDGNGVSTTSDTGSGKYIESSYIQNGTTMVIAIWIADGTTVTNLEFSPMVSFGSEAVPYEPLGTLYTINFEDAGTVYGGSLDVLTGVLTVNKAMRTFDGSNDEIWAMNTGQPATAHGNRVYIANPNGIKTESTSQLPAFLLSNQFKKLASASTWYGTNGVSIGINGAIEIMRDGVDSLDTWRGLLSNEPLQVAYELAAPLTFQLTSHQVATLLGQNTIWADTGDVTVDYFAERSTSLIKYLSENLKISVQTPLTAPSSRSKTA